MRTVSLLAVFLAGCAADVGNGEGAGELSSDRVIEEGTPQAAGVLAMLNDAGTTFTVLDDAVGLDRRAAQNLVKHRDGADGRFGTSDDNKYDTVDEIDAIAYVGDAALADLLAYAVENDWIPAADDYYGSIEGVEFTVSQAAATVALCNTAPLSILDVDAALDSRAASNLVAQRPFATLEAVAAVSYVGASALTNLRNYAAAHPGTTLGTTAAVTTLTAATPGLYYTSESDFPLVAFVVPGGGATPVTVDNVKSLIASDYVARPEEPTLAQRAVEQRTIADVLDRYTVREDWWEDFQVTDQPKWQTIRDVFELGLTSGTVYRFGGRDSQGNMVGSIDVFVIGVSAEGDLVVIKTISVET